MLDAKKAGLSSNSFPTIPLSNPFSFDLIFISIPSNFNPSPQYKAGPTYLERNQNRMQLAKYVFYIIPGK